MEETVRKEIIESQDKYSELGTELLHEIMFESPNIELFKKMAYVAYRTGWIDGNNISSLNSKSMEYNFKTWLNNIFGIE